MRILTDLQLRLLAEQQDMPTTADDLLTEDETAACDELCDLGLMQVCDPGDEYTWDAPLTTPADAKERELQLLARTVEAPR